MEDGLRRVTPSAVGHADTGLNPCCNGRWSQTNQSILEPKKTSLNPCCNGRWSQTVVFNYTHPCDARLNPCCNGRWSQTRRSLDASTLNRVS